MAMTSQKGSLRCVSMLLVCLFLALNPLRAFAQSPAETIVRLIPEETRLQVGEAAELVVEVLGAQGLYGFDLQLTFDPHILEVVDADAVKDGVQVQQGDFLDPGFIARNEADNQHGGVWFAMTQLNPSEAKSGDGALIVIQFRSTGSPGEVLIEFAHIQLANRDGVEIPATAKPARLTVIPSPGNNPTQPAPSAPATRPPLPGGATATNALMPTLTPPRLTPTQKATIQPPSGSSLAEIMPSTETAGMVLLTETGAPDLVTEGDRLQGLTPAASVSQPEAGDGGRNNRYSWQFVVFGAGLLFGLVVLIIILVGIRRKRLKERT